jgi:hypothetical protein
MERKKNQTKQYSPNELLIPRGSLAQYLGQYGFEGKRDYSKTLGYPEALTYNDFYNVYSRQDIAFAIINAFPEATWKDKPVICTKGKEFEEKDPFKDMWNTLANKLKLFHYLDRVDKLSNIGRYSVLLLGFDDTKDKTDFSKPVKANAKLRYILPRSEINAQITDWDQDIKSDNFGKPLFYNIKTTTLENFQYGSLKVHYSRVIHVAERLLEDDVYGMPMLQSVFNRLIDLTKVAGGSAEMFWQGAFFGISFEMDADADATEDDRKYMTEQIDDYIHKLRRYVKLQGVKAKVLNGSIESPKEHVETMLSFISAATRIPKRMLIGSEQGELSSDQDDDSWKARVDERRMDFGDRILKEFIDRLQLIGSIPDVEYSITWPDIWAPSEKDKMNIARIKSEALANYSRASDAKTIVPPDIFLSQILGFPSHLVEKIKKQRETDLKEIYELLQEESQLNKPDFDLEDTEFDVEDRTNPVSEVARDRQGNR